MKPITARIEQTKAALKSAREAYLAAVHVKPADEVKTCDDAVKALQKQVSALITEGCVPCPSCGNMPWGMEQPRRAGKDGEVEWEIGCLHCPPTVISRTKKRHRRVRGGLIPQHAVEAWNELAKAWPG